MNVRIARDGVEIGECDWEDLEELLNEGQVLATDHYWYEGMPDWRLLADLITLAESESEPVAPQPPSSWEAGEFTAPPPCPVDWEVSEPGTAHPSIHSRRIVTTAIVCLAAVAAGVVLYLIAVFFDRHPSPRSPTATSTSDAERTDTGLRTKATSELAARLGKLPRIAAPPSYTFYDSLSIEYPNPPASLTVAIRGTETTVDSKSKATISRADFVVTADFRESKWFFKHYHASVNDLVHDAATEIDRDDHYPIPPAIVSLMGLQLESVKSY